MKVLYKNGLLAIDGQLVKKDMIVDGDRIAEIGCNLNGDMQTVDLNGKKVYPKLFDEHTHGSFGHDFNLSTVDEMSETIEFYKTQNIGTVFPTMLTDRDDVFVVQLEKMVKLAKRHKEVRGIHLEGPFLAKDYKGAMPEYLLQLPSVKLLETYLKASNGLVKLMTVSPEVEGAPEFIKEAVKLGVNINLGHSGASYDRTMECLDAGANCFTHVFNAMRVLHHHDVGILGCALESDAYCECIMDGLHLEPNAVKLIKKVKGLDKMIVVTDSIMAGGLPDGNYMLGVYEVVVKNGDARLAHADVRAGSTLKAMNAWNNLAKFTNIPKEQAILAMTKTPAIKNGMFDEIGELAVGKLAEFFVED